MLSLLTMLVLTAAPADFDALRTRALAAYEARDYKRACALYTQAARLSPEHAAVQADLGLCLMKQGRKAEAVHANLRAVQKAAETCLARAGGCDGGVSDCPSALRCIEEACAEAERTPSPAVLAEQQLAQQAVDRCDTKHPLPYTECSVVLADACLGLVGVVCESSTVAPDGKVLGKTSRDVREVWLQRTEP